MGYGSSIAEAIARMGNAQAAGAQRKGELYSGLAQNLGQIPMQIYGMQQQQQQNQASNALIGQRLEAGKMDLAERQREEKIAQDVRSILASGGTDNDVLEYLKVNDPKAFQTAQRLLQEQGIAQLNLMEGRPGALPAEVPLPATPDEPVTPLSAHEAPHPEVNIPGLGSVRPRTQNEVTQRLLAQKQAEARIRREENTYDINGMRLPSQAIGPVITGQTAIHRQKDQQEFTAGENEKNRAARLEAAKLRPQRDPSQLTPYQHVRTEFELRKEFNNSPIVKEYDDVRKQMARVESAIEQAKTSKNFVAIDQALINGLNKMIDPQSVVREGEYARTIQNSPLLSRALGKIQQIREGGGGFTDEERNALVSMMREFYRDAEGLYETHASEYERLADGGRLDKSRIVIRRDKIGSQNENKGKAKFRFDPNSGLVPVK